MRGDLDDKEEELEDTCEELARTKKCLKEAVRTEGTTNREE
jgi:hypothetical protein